MNSAVKYHFAKRRLVV